MLQFIKYGEERVEGNLSRIRSLEEYLKLFKEVAGEIYRILKPGEVLGIPFGDTRTRKHFVPLTHYVLLVFPGAGFVLKEEVVKIQIK